MSASRWAALKALAAQPISLRQAFSDDPARASRYNLTACGIMLDYSKNLITAQSWQALQQLAAQSPLQQQLQAMLAGAKINHTEQRAVWHMMLRKSDVTGLTLDGEDIGSQILSCRQKMTALVNQLHQGEYKGYSGKAITDLIWVGIGGSLLGPQMAVEALTPYHCSPVKLHFAGNIDGAVVSDVVKHLDPATTLVFVASKSFGTEETKQNALAVRQWFTEHGADASAIARHFWATSSNIKAAAEFGIVEENILPMWDWVGGRYSLWSAVGFPIALAIGFERFEQLLEGAAQMDAHALDAPLERNLPVLHGLTDIWNRNLLGHATHAVMTYDQRLALLPAYLQQLVMESLGKRVQRDGQPVTTDTVPVWWGGAGTDVQHSFFQALHQGTSIIPADFIGCVHNDDPYTVNHQALMANLLAQTEALANGQGSDDPHRDYPGGRPSTLILLDALTPQALGALIAMYEHAVYVQSVIWNINAFDQFGVELGKQLASGLLPALQGEDVAVADPMTREILAQLKG